MLTQIKKSLQKYKAEKLEYFPHKISVDLGNICNLQCPLCPTGERQNKDVRKGLMSLENFKIIFSKIKPFVKTLDLFNWGEPFLNKNLVEIIKYVKEEKPSVRLFIDSNFNIVTDEQIDGIARYGLDVLKISCDGATQDIYKQYRIGGDVEVVKKNIKKLVAKKKELNTKFPKIIWKYLVFKHNQHEVALARQMAKEFEIEFEDSGMRIDCGREIFEDVHTSVERDKQWIPDDLQYNNYQDIDSKKTSFCGKPWTTLVVDWNGDVAPCGAIYEVAKYKYGNLVTQDFKDVWNNEKYQEARSIILGKTPVENSSTICATCKKNNFQFF